MAFKFTVTISGLKGSDLAAVRSPPHLGDPNPEVGKKV